MSRPRRPSKRTVSSTQLFPAHLAQWFRNYCVDMDLKPSALMQLIVTRAMDAGLKPQRRDTEPLQYGLPKELAERLDQYLGDKMTKQEFVEHATNWFFGRSND